MVKSIYVHFNNLDECEAEMLGTLFSEYIAKCHADKIRVMCSDTSEEEKQNHLAWIDSHLEWFEDIYKKMSSGVMEDL